MREAKTWTIFLVVACCMCLAGSAAKASDPGNEFGAPASDAFAFFDAATGPGVYSGVWDNQVPDAAPSSAPQSSPFDTIGATMKSTSPVTPSWAMLEALTDDERANAVVLVELVGAAGAAEHDASFLAEQLWSAGDFDTSIEMIRRLEDRVGVGIGIAWKDPVPCASPENLSDARIGTRSDGGMVALDYDVATGNLFAVVHWTDTTANWSVNISTNGGETWAETYTWGTSGWADAVVAGDWLYVGYMFAGDLSEGRMRRFSVVDGGVDSVYGHQVVVDTDPVFIDEIVVFSNADFTDDRIYFVFIESDGSLRAFWDLSSDGTNFQESSDPSPISNADSGLDSHWNPLSPTNRYTWQSYLGTDNAIHVWRWDGAGWTEMRTLPGYNGHNHKTKISAHGDNVIVGFEVDTNPDEIYYEISYNGGNSWLGGSLGGFAASCSDFDLTARGGMGTAGIYGLEVGIVDDLLFRSRANYASGSWTEPERFNDHDILTGGTDMEINWLGDGYGMVYIDENGVVWFDRPDLLFADRFEMSDTTLWWNSTN